MKPINLPSRRWRGARHRVLFLAAVLATSGVAASVPAAAQPPELDVLDLAVPPNAEVRFRESRAREQAGLPFDSLDHPVFEESTSNFRVLADMTEVAFDDLYKTGYSFPVYLIPLADPGRTFRYTVKADVVGTLVDARRSVGFRIGPEESGETATLEIPVYSPTPAPYVDLEHEGLFRMKLGEVGRYPVRLRNRLDGMPSRLELVEPIEGRSDCWSHLELTAPAWSDDGLELTPKVDHELEILAQVKTLPALWKGFLPASVSGPHDSLRLNLRYQTQGGQPVVVPLNIDVQFVPSGPALAVAVLIGVLLGNLVILALRRPKLRTWIRVVLAAVPIAFVVWFIGIGLHEAHSRLQIFGLDVNPVEVPGAGIIGFVIGLAGPKVLDLFERLFKRWGESQSVAAGGGG